MKAAAPAIVIGHRIGGLTVVSQTAERKNGYTVWKCHCDCGNEILLDSRAIKRGTIVNCGCIPAASGNIKDVSNVRFGMLTAIEPVSSRKYGSIVWRCRCDCGNEIEAPLKQLSSGYRKSCGCLSKPELKDYIGKRFGKLTVVEYAEKKRGMHHWLCRCDCGNETVVGQTPLQNGKTKSCGCIQREMYKKNLILVDGTSVRKLESVKKTTLSSNTSGYNGVYLNRKIGKWSAQITFKGRTYYLGSFDNIEDAVKARKTGEEMHDDFLEWYYGMNKQGVNNAINGDGIIQTSADT